MTDYPWPSGLVPSQQTFYLQPHTGGSESPFSRVTKVYALAAPRWICSLSFRGGYWGTTGLDAVGPRLDAFLAKLKGRQNRALLYDFRRPAMRAPLWPANANNLAAALGATTMTLTNLLPGLIVRGGDYIGGDGRPHIITDDVQVGTTGQAVVSFVPPLKAAVGAGAAIFGKPTAPFRLVSDDAGANATTVGEAVAITLDFVEDL